MPNISIKPNLSDYRFAEALIIFPGIYALEYVSQNFQEEQYRFWLWIVCLALMAAYMIIKILKDQHHEKILNDKASSLANLDQKG